MSSYALIDPATGEATHVSAKPQHIQNWAQAKQGFVVVEGDQNARVSGAAFDLEHGEWVDPKRLPEVPEDKTVYREPSAMMRAKMREIGDFKPVPVPDELRADFQK